MKDNYLRRAIIREIYDGDTITKCDVDLGYDCWNHNQSFRLYGINTPEIKTGTAASKELGRLARDTFRTLLDLADGQCYLQSIKESLKDEKRNKKGKYGRWLAIVYLHLPDNVSMKINGFDFNPPNGVPVCYNDLVVSLGLGKLYLKDKKYIRDTL